MPQISGFPRAFDTLSGASVSGLIDNVDIVNKSSPWPTIAAAISDLGAVQGIVVVPSSYTAAFPAATAVPNNISILDLTDSQNLVGNILPANIEIDAYNGPGTTNRVFGFAAQGFATGGGTGIAGQGETVGLFGGGARTAGSRSIWASNFVVQIANNTNTAHGLEVDFNNNSGTDAGITNNPGDQMIGIEIVSGGTNRPLEAIRITTSGAATRWQEGILIANWQQFGIRIFQDPSAPAVTGPCLYMVPSSNGSSPVVQVRNAADTLPMWQVLQNGFQILANNVQIQAQDTGGIARTVLFHGADAGGGSMFLYAGASNNGFLTDNAGNSALQWSPTGVILNHGLLGLLVNTNVLQGTGAKHTRHTFTTSTAAAVGATVTETVTWPGPAFANSAYTVAATPSAASNVYAVSNVTNKTTTTIDVTIAALTAAAATGTVDLIAFHD